MELSINASCEKMALVLIQSEASTCMAEGRWDRACELWARLRQARSDDLQAHVSGVESLVRAYRFEEARDLASQTEERFAGKISAEMFLATFTARQGLWEEGVRRFEQIAGRSPAQAARVMRNPAYRQAVLNAEGIVAGCRRLEPVTHSQAAEQPDTDEREGGAREYVFVSGMPRAGTTALGHLLNSESSVALLTEMHNAYLPYSPASFSPQMIRRCVGRNSASAPGNMRVRVETAAHVGDKRPHFHYALPLTSETMAACRMVTFHILRPVVHVATSYAKRACDPDDQWDPLRDLGNCVRELNTMHRFILDWHRSGPASRPHSLVYVDYGRVFSEPGYAMSLFRAIGLPADRALRGSVLNFQQRSVAVVAKKRQVPNEVRAALERGLDFEAANSVAALTGVEILAGL